MKLRHLLALALVPAGLLASRGDPPQAPPPRPVGAGDANHSAYQKDVLPFLKRHCFACHGNGKAKADLSFDKYTDDASVAGDRKVWDNVRHMLKAREMPPPERPQPKAAEVEAVTAAIQGIFDRADAAAKPNAGRVTIRRLNRTEYNNTIRDLRRRGLQARRRLPGRRRGVRVRQHRRRAVGLAAAAGEVPVGRRGDPRRGDRDRRPAEARRSRPSTRSAPVPPRPPGKLGKMVSFEAGDYHIRCKVGGDQLGDEPVRVMLRVMGEDVKEFEVKATADKPEVIEATAPREAGHRPRRREVPQPDRPRDRRKERVLHLKGVEVEGPFDPPPLVFPEAHTRLMAHKPGLPPREAAREIVTRFATRAFRRPVKPEEVERCLALYDAAEKKGQRFELRVRAALYRVLVSPHFLFRVELDPPGLPPGTTYPIGEYELASRLSYFLWNSMPDDELFSLAGKGQVASESGGAGPADGQGPEVAVVPARVRRAVADAAEARPGVARPEAVPDVHAGAARGDDPREPAVLRGAGPRGPEHPATCWTPTSRS